MKLKKKSNAKLKKELLQSKGYKPRKGVVKICPVCFISFYKRQSHLTRIFCSKKCNDINQKTGKEYKCEECGKMSYRNNGQIKHRGTSRFCSKKCKGKSMKKMIRAMMPKKKKEVSPAKLKRKLWKVFSQFIKQRDGENCFTCGVKCDGANAHCGHFIPKSVGGLALYFNEDNNHKQCARCNIWLGGNQYIYGQKLGEKKVKELYALKNQITKNYPFEEKIEYYKQKIKEL